MRQSAKLTIAAVALSAALAISLQLAAQDTHDHQPHHHYQLIDLGTFGGPQAFTQDQLPFLTNRGVVAGWADTSTPDPNYPNSCFFCFFSPFIVHAFQWKEGALTDLGALPGVNSSEAFWTSNNGQTAGISENGATDPLLGIPAVHAVFWKDGQITDLGTLEGGYESGAFAVNSEGAVAGFSNNLVPDPFNLITTPSGTTTQQRTFLWQNGVMRDLGTLGGTDAGLLGDQGNIEINERGQVAACSYTNSTRNPTTGTPTLDPFLWDEKNGMQDLGTLGGTSGCAINLNNRSQVIGYSNVPGDVGCPSACEVHPFLWGGGGLRDLGTFGGTSGRAIAINDGGDVVGWAMDQNEQVRAFLWRNGVKTNLGTLSPLPYSNAQWINSKGQVVGFAADANFITRVAFLWENGGPMVDLNSLVPPGSELQLTNALNINDRGEIAGTGLLPDGDFRNFLVIPCDENHPSVEGCDYNLVDATTAASPSPLVSDAARRTPLQFGTRQVYESPFRAGAFGRRN
jgi:probable HAF family extracellular repeat protein